MSSDAPQSCFSKQKNTNLIASQQHPFSLVLTSLTLFSSFLVMQGCLLYVGQPCRLIRALSNFSSFQGFTVRAFCILHVTLTTAIYSRDSALLVPSRFPVLCKLLVRCILRPATSCMVKASKLQHRSENARKFQRSVCDFPFVCTCNMYRPPVH